MRNNKRAGPRRNLNYVGLIVNVDGTAICPCSTADISATGAKIVPSEQTEIPDEFVLVLAPGGKVQRRCKVVWRLDGKLGVQFVIAPDVAGKQI
jgi:hypothetical protein